jgi:DNA-binding MarR family transcriptional regulator
MRQSRHGQIWSQSVVKSTDKTLSSGGATKAAAGTQNGERHAEMTIRDLLSYRIHQVSSQISRSAALQYRSHFDVSLGEWRALALLGAGVALSLNELARAADLDKAQMSRIIAGLSKRDLITRDEGSTRGQTVRLALTRKGQALYRRLIEAAVKRNDAFLACLNTNERRVLDEALVKLSALARALMAAEQSSPLPRAASKR